MARISNPVYATNVLCLLFNPPPKTSGRPNKPRAHRLSEEEINELMEWEAAKEKIQDNEERT